MNPYNVLYSIYLEHVKTAMPATTFTKINSYFESTLRYSCRDGDIYLRRYYSGRYYDYSGRYYVIMTDGVDIDFLKLRFRKAEQNGF